MIYTLAFSPILKITYRSVRHVIGAENAVERTGEEVTGAAAKVCRALDELNADYCGIFFTGGAAGEEIQRLLKDKNCRFLPRVNANALSFSVKSVKTTAFSESVSPVPHETFAALFEQLKLMRQNDVALLPEKYGAALSESDMSHIFSEICALGGRLVLFADAATIKTALKYSPYCLITDTAEAGAYFGKKIVSEKDILQCMSLLQKTGAQSAIIFAGNKLYATGDMGGIYRADAAKLPRDAFCRAVAEFVALSDRGKNFEDALKQTVVDVTSSLKSAAGTQARFTVLREPIKTQAIRNVSHYLIENSAVTFDKKPLNILDIAIFTQLTMLDIGKLPSSPVTMKAARDKYIERHPDGYVDVGVVVPQTYPLLALCADSDRFGAVKLIDRSSVIDDEKVVQFTAITFLLPTGEYIAVFNGTDDTIVGWKENFYLLYDKPTESQRRAAAYLAELAEKVGKKGRIYAAGHSKGGNLAIYGAVKGGAALAEKLCGVYNFDGPGFTKSFYTTEEFAAVKDKILTIIPQLSVIGRLFNHEESAMIVKSCFAGLYQHDLFSWETEGDAFVTVPKMDELSDKVQAKVNETMATLSEEQCKVFVDGLFSLLYSTDSFTLTHLMINRGKLFGNFFKCDAKTRRALLSMTMNLLSDRYVREMIFATLREAKKMQAKKEFEVRSIVSGKIENAIEAVGIAIEDDKTAAGKKTS